MLPVGFSSSSLRLRVFARDMFFLCRLRDMATSDGYYAEAPPVTASGQTRRRKLGGIAVNARPETQSPEWLARLEEEIAEGWRELEGMLG